MCGVCPCCHGNGDCCGHLMAGAWECRLGELSTLKVNSSPPRNTEQPSFDGNPRPREGKCLIKVMQA